MKKDSAIATSLGQLPPCCRKKWWVAASPYFNFFFLPLAGLSGIICPLGPAYKEETATMEIINQFSEKIKGVLSTFDRLVFKGTLRCFYRKNTLDYFLFEKKILKKNFSTFARSYTQEIVKHGINLARKSSRPYIYLESYKESKEEKAKQIMISENIEEGLICVLSCVESCSAFGTKKNEKTGHQDVVPKLRKCLHLYFYYVDPQFGFMYVRLQTWFPFQIQLYINGREYLARQLDEAGISYKRYDNSFLHISDVEKAQEIADKLLEKKWILILDAFANKVNPVLNDIKRIITRGGYFWSLWQCEYATDIMFKSREELETVYPDFVQQATLSFSCEDVMTFLGRKLYNNFKGEVVSDMKRRPQGIRVKHRMKTNVIKMYDKLSVLRIETVINAPYEFKVYREVTRKGETKMAWAPMGKCVSNIYRYAKVSEASNIRYWNALSSVKESSSMRKELEAICNPVEKKGKRFSGFNAISEECCRIFLAVLDGGNFINGFTNKKLRAKLYSEAESNPIEKKRAVGRTTRLLAKLRAHALIAKIPHSFRYKITKKGVRVMTILLMFKRKEIPKLATG